MKIEYIVRFQIMSFEQVDIQALKKCVGEWRVSEFMPLLSKMALPDDSDPSFLFVDCSDHTKKIMLSTVLVKKFPSNRKASEINKALLTERDEMKKKNSTCVEYHYPDGRTSLINVKDIKVGETSKGVLVGNRFCDITRASERMVHFKFSKSGTLPKVEMAPYGVLIPVVIPSDEEDTTTTDHVTGSGYIVKNGRVIVGNGGHATVTSSGYTVKY